MPVFKASGAPEGILRPGRDHMVEVVRIHGTEGIEAEPVAVSRNRGLQCETAYRVCGSTVAVLRYQYFKHLSVLPFGFGSHLAPII